MAAKGKEESMDAILDNLLRFIPEGWPMPLGWELAVDKAKAQIELLDQAGKNMGAGEFTGLIKSEVKALYLNLDEK